MHQAVVEVGTDICRDISEAARMWPLYEKPYHKLLPTRDCG